MLICRKKRLPGLIEDAGLNFKFSDGCVTKWGGFFRQKENKGNSRIFVIERLDHSGIEIL